MSKKRPRARIKLIDTNLTDSEKYPKYCETQKGIAKLVTEITRHNCSQESVSYAMRNNTMLFNRFLITRDERK